MLGMNSLKIDKMKTGVLLWPVLHLQRTTWSETFSVSLKITLLYISPVTVSVIFLVSG
jgi:hypothetical protein